MHPVMTVSPPPGDGGAMHRTTSRLVAMASSAIVMLLMGIIPKRLSTKHEHKTNLHLQFLGMALPYLVLTMGQIHLYLIAKAIQRKINECVAASATLAMMMLMGAMH